MPRRVEFTIKYSVNLDGVPGWGYQPEDFVELAKQNFLRPVRHYRPTAELIDDKVRFEKGTKLPFNQVPVGQKLKFYGNGLVYTRIKWDGVSVLRDHHHGVEAEQCITYISGGVKMPAFCPLNADTVVEIVND